jgi:hypothetical protein
MKLRVFITPKPLFFSKANTVALHIEVLRKFTLYLQLWLCNCTCDLCTVSSKET